MDLSDFQKTLWQYICDKCDNAGVFSLSIRIASVLINTKGDIQKGIDYFCNSGRIKKISKDKYWIVKFISFQFGELHEKSNLHKNVIQKLREHKLYEEYFKGLSTLNEPLIKGQGIVKVNGKGKLIEDKEERAQAIERILKAFPKVVLHNDALVSICNAIQREVDKGSSESNAISVIEEAVIDYAKQLEDPKFSKQACEWFNGGGYLSVEQNKSEWVQF